MVAAPSDDSHGPQGMSNGLSPTEEEELGVGEQGGQRGSRAFKGPPGCLWSALCPPGSERTPSLGPCVRSPVPNFKCLLCAGCGRSAQDTQRAPGSHVFRGRRQLHVHLTETSGKAWPLEPYQAGEACFGALLPTCLQRREGPQLALHPRRSGSQPCGSRCGRHLGPPLCAAPLRPRQGVAGGLHLLWGHRPLESVGFVCGSSAGK